MRRRPREVPVAKPSAVQSYVPQVLLRREEHDTRRRWMPNEHKPGASKHSANQQQDVMKIKVVNEMCSEAEVEKLEALEEEVTLLENEVRISAKLMGKFVGEFYVAAAMFTTQAKTQRTLLQRLQHLPTQSKE